MKTFLLPTIVLEMALGVTEAATPPAGPVTPRAEGNLGALILEHSERARLNPRLVKAVITVESDSRPGAVSPRGARGLMQVMPATAEEVGVPAAALHEPAANLRAGTAYLGRLYRAARSRYALRAQRLQDAPPWVQRRVLAAYNGGTRCLYGDRWPAQTRRYVARVAGLAGLPCPPARKAAAPDPSPVPAPETWEWTLEL